MAEPKTIWFIGLDAKEKEEFSQVLKNGSQIKTQLLKVLEFMYNNVDRKGFKEDEYSDNNWVFKQAFNNGRLAVIRDLVDLIS